MPMIKTEIKIETADGAYDAYLAMPETSPAGGVIVIQEIFGVNDNIKDVANWLATMGYLALAPDLFWRIEPNVSLSDQTEAEWQKAFALMNAFDGDKGVGDIQAAITHLRTHPACNGKIGTIGFCLGGRLAYLAATRTDSDANISYYGVGLQDLLGEAKQISAPLVVHIAGRDEFVPPEAQAAIHAGLAAYPQVQLYDYADQDHAFTRENGMHYDAPATQLAHGRSLEVLAQNLK